MSVELSQHVLGITLRHKYDPVHAVEDVQLVGGENAAFAVQDTTDGFVHHFLAYRGVDGAEWVVHYLCLC